MTVAVVCALNFDRNPGMVTVDRAAKAFFAGRDLDIDWLIAGHGDAHDPGVDDLLDFRSVFDEPGYPEKYNNIVFWGDFLQSRVHHDSLVPAVIEGGYASDEDEARRFLREYLLFENAPEEMIEKVAIVGATIHADGVDTLIDKPFRSALSRLLAGARCVRMREPVSTYRAAVLSGRDGTVGMDAAFLSIQANAWNTDAERNRREGPVRIAVAGGRSDRKHGRKLKFAALSVLRAFERRDMKVTLEVLPWLSPGLGRWGWFPVETPSMVRAPDYCLDRLKDCDALVTDVYHAAVNAWVMGIPVVLLGRGAETDATAIKSKKKELLALSLFAGDNYVFFENISYFRFRELGEQLHGILTSDKENAMIFEQRARDVAWFLGKLEAEIRLPARKLTADGSLASKSTEMQK